MSSFQTEGTAAEFTLTRTGDTAAALTVAVSVSEDGAVLAGTAPTEAVFAAGAASVDLAVATEDDEVAGDGSVVTVALEAGAGYTLDADASSATVTVEDDDAAPENAAPTGLPTIAGTARVGETLTASASDIADADGLTNAVFAWQWLANDGTADTDFADATEATYTLTAAEAGKTIKVRATFTDDAGTEETLVSEATAAVAAALPMVSIAASTSPVTEGSQSIAMGSEATFTPTVELGLRHDAGDAETGTGVEAGVGLLYSNPAQGLTVEGRVRGLLTHADSGYEEWGASGSVRLDPGISGRGVSLTLAPVWGAASGGVEQLWSTRPAAGLAVDDESGVEARLEAELGYGFGVAGNAGVLTPYAGFSMANGGDGRTQRVGMRWRAAPAFEMELEGRHGEADGDTEPTTSATLRAAWRW